MYKVLIVEDDQKISSILYNHLKKWNFDPYVAEDFEQIDQQFLSVNPDIILLDINLPNFDGFYWCQKIRQVSNVPIIFISSRNENMDIVMAMNLGGDDFIQKPFSLDILIAKMNAILRRIHTYIDLEKNFLEYNGLVLHIESNVLSYKDNQINLTQNEFHILFLLLKKAGGIVPRDELIEALWENENFIDDNTLTVNINRIRNKLDTLGLRDVIETKKRQGYILR